MEKIPQILDELSKIYDIRFARLLRICKTFFGIPRVSGSHHIFKTPWPGDPRINLQKSKGGFAKPYQVRQVISALQKLLNTRMEDNHD